VIPAPHGMPLPLSSDVDERLQRAEEIMREVKSKLLYSPRADKLEAGGKQIWLIYRYESIKAYEEKYGEL